ncbi:hypothetical protein EI94DRAFT_1695847 [Lactarius quietus]|nr:hypothetical protein EI94DRAFT_1695847 [Lactarius quietus]
MALLSCSLHRFHGGENPSEIVGNGLGSMLVEEKLVDESRGPHDKCLKKKYHHIRVEDADALLKHWTQRQAAGEIPFQFNNGVNTNQHGKNVSVNANTSDPVGQGTNQKGLYRIPRRTRNEQVMEHPKEVVRDRLSRCLEDRVEETLPGTQANLSPIPATKGLPKLPRHIKSCQQRKMGGMMFYIHPTLHPPAHAYTFLKII